MIAYTIDVANRLTRTTISGITTFRHLAEHFQKIMSDPNFERSYDTLITIEKGTTGNLLPQEMDFKALVEKYEKFRVGAKWALVFPDETSVALAELFFRKVRLTNVRMQFFMDEKSALAWLGR